MSNVIEPMHVHSPRSLREVFAILRENPGIGLIAGGTDCLRRVGRGEPVRLPGSLVSLAEVDELSRIRRRENSIEIGAAVSLERIISLGGNLVPTLFIRVLERVAHPAARNLATIGGNIALASVDSDALLPLLLLDARCELRRPTAHAWVPLARFIKGPGRIALDPLEILTAVSLPLPHWNVRMYVKLDRTGSYPDAGSDPRRADGNPDGDRSEPDSPSSEGPALSPSTSLGMDSAEGGFEKTPADPEPHAGGAPVFRASAGTASVEGDDVAGTATSLLKFAALANVSKATVTDFRFIWGGVDPLFMRSREIEALIIGAKTPFSQKQAAVFAEKVAAYIDTAPPSFLPEPYHRRSAVRLARAFLEKVGMYRETWIPKREP
ncbi:MAG: FAD binding domain-containing protein [Spirochaetales bacterium]|nr:FAD binding domain-containing protein [Spirochaetales bacterium]